jgi:hypothetical protein
MKADVVHLDMTLGGISIEELSPVELTNLRASRIERQNSQDFAQIKKNCWRNQEGS